MIRTEVHLADYMTRIAFLLHLIQPNFLEVGQAEVEDSNQKA